MNYSNSTWNRWLYSVAHIYMDPIPTTFGTSCAQILGPEIKLVTVVEGNILKTDSSSLESSIIMVIRSAKVAFVLLYII